MNLDNGQMESPHAGIEIGFSWCITMMFHSSSLLVNILAFVSQMLLHLHWLIWKFDAIWVNTQWHHQCFWLVATCSHIVDPLEQCYERSPASWMSATDGLTMKSEITFWEQAQQLTWWWPVSSHQRMRIIVETQDWQHGVDSLAVTEVKIRLLVIGPIPINNVSIM